MCCEAWGGRDECSWALEVRGQWPCGQPCWRIFGVQFFAACHTGGCRIQRSSLYLKACSWLPRMVFPVRFTPLLKGTNTSAFPVTFPVTARAGSLFKKVLSHSWGRTWFLIAFSIWYAVPTALRGCRKGAEEARTTHFLHSLQLMKHCRGVLQMGSTEMHCGWAHRWH